jgi:hypothetical protein
MLTKNYRISSMRNGWLQKFVYHRIRYSKRLDLLPKFLQMRFGIEIDEAKYNGVRDD